MLVKNIYLHRVEKAIPKTCSKNVEIAVGKEEKNCADKVEQSTSQLLFHDLFFK